MKKKDLGVDPKHFIDEYSALKPVYAIDFTGNYTQACALLQHLNCKIYGGNYGFSKAQA